METGSCSVMLTCPIRRILWCQGTAVPPAGAGLAAMDPASAAPGRTINCLRFMISLRELETESYAELQLARDIRLPVVPQQSTKVSVRGIEYGIPAKDGMIEQVERFHPKLDDVSLSDRRVLCQRDVKLRSPAVAQIAEVLGSSTQRKRRQNLKDRLFSGSYISDRAVSVNQPCFKHPVPCGIRQVRVA